MEPGEIRSKKVIDVMALVDRAAVLGIPAEEVSEAVMRKMSSTEEPQGILAIIEKTDFDWEDMIIDDKTIILILDKGDYQKNKKGAINECKY